MRPAIDILVSNSNTSELLITGIVEPLADFFGKQLNLVIVDDSSDPADLASLKLQLTVPHTLIEHASNRGVTLTMNHLTELATGKYRFLCNSDVIIPSIHDLYLMTTLLDQFNGRALVGTAEGPRFLLQTGKPYTLTPGPNDVRPYVQDYVSACAMMYSGLDGLPTVAFDKNYSPGYYEDTALSYTLRRAGFLTLYCQTGIHHLGNVAIIRHQAEHTRDDNHTPWHDVQDAHRKQFLSAWADCLSPRAETYAQAKINWFHTQRYLTERA